MPNAIELRQHVYKAGSATMLARIVGEDGEAINQATIDSIKYSLAVIDPQDEDADIPVADHADVSLDADAVIFDELQTDARWTVDSVGYNFRHVLDVLTHPAFAHAGKEYRLTYTLQPKAAGAQPIIVRFRLEAI